MKIVLYSSGLGYINRGLETFTNDIHKILKDHYDVILFKGRGEKNEDSISLFSIRRNSIIYNYFPFRYLSKYSLLIENLIFSIPIIFYVLVHKNVVLYFSETDVANIVLRFKKMFNLKIILLFSNGGPGSPSWYDKYDFIHLLNNLQYKESISFGIDPKKIFVIPYFIDETKFFSTFSNDFIKKKYNLPLNKKLILSVGAVNIHHKRMHWLINEFSNLSNEDYHLVILGQLEAESLKVTNYAKSKLPHNNYTFIQCSYSEIPLIYKISYLFVLCSLVEGFGRVYLEAMISELYVIAHKHELTEYILGSNNPGLINMKSRGELYKSIDQIDENMIKNISFINKQKAINEFSIIANKNKYLDMFKYLSTSFN